MRNSPFATDISCDSKAFLDCLRRQGTPLRVHFIELFLDEEVRQALLKRYHLADDLNPDDPFFYPKTQIALQRFLGYDYVSCGAGNYDYSLSYFSAEDTADLKRREGRDYINEHRGPITNWEEFEKYPWPDTNKITLDEIQWYEENLPEDMCLIAWDQFGAYAELITWLMGYETLCFALYEQRDLVRAISERLIKIGENVLGRLLEFERVKIVWSSDDMGYKTGTLIAPDDLREFALSGHKRMAQLAHQAGKPYLLHSCGKLDDIMEDLIVDIGMDGKHSFEDTIENVIDVKQQYGDRLTLLGGIDVDFLCRADEAQIRRRVRETLEKCMPGGGYCLGTGNTVANYIPVENYLIMLDEGRNFSP